MERFHMKMVCPRRKNALYLANSTKVSSMYIFEHERSSPCSFAATTIRCFRTGYYDNPTDCTQFIACLLDPRSRAYILHFMRCPAGLSWDNTRKLCMESSSTCYSNSRYHSNGANSRVSSPEDGVQLRQKDLLFVNGGDAS